MHELVAASDVVISNYIPRAARSLKADYASLKAIKDDIIVGSIVGYRPDSDRPGYDAIIQAEAGYYYINGNPNLPGWLPTKMPVPLMDILAGHQLKQALLMALLRKERSGAGANVTVSLFDAAVSALTNQATGWLVAGQVPQPLGSEHPNIAPYGSVYQTRDDHAIVLGVGTDRQFAHLCDLLDRPGLPDDERFRINRDRVENRHALNHILAEAIRVFNRDDLLRMCEERRIPAGAVRQVDEVMQSTPGYMHLQRDGISRGVRETAIWPPAAPESLPGLSAPPAFAQHSTHVLRDLLGYDDGAIAGLIDNQVVTQSGH